MITRKELKELIIVCLFITLCIVGWSFAFGAVINPVNASRLEWRICFGVSFVGWLASGAYVTRKYAQKCSKAVLP